MPWVTPSSVSTGDVLQASQWNQDVVANGAELAPFFAAWTSYTPTLSQGASSNISKTVTYARYIKIGRWITVQVYLDITGTGSAGSNITCTLPVASASSALLAIGTGRYDDAGSASYGVMVRLASTTTCIFQTQDVTTGGNVGGNPSFAVANTDSLLFTASYESAS